MVTHAGNAINQMTFEEHDGANNAKRVSIALAGAGLTSLPTLYAVVNTNAGGGTTTVTPVGLTTLASSPNFIGLVTVTGNVGISSAATIFAVVNTTASGQASVALDNSLAKIGYATVFPAVAWPDPKTYIGLVTIGGIGTVTLADPKGFIGLTTTTLGASPAFVGIVTVANQLPLVASPAFIGLVTVAGIGTLTLSDPKGYIGLVTIGGIGTLTLADPKGFIGLVTIGGMSSVTLVDSKGFIGLVTAVTINGGTNKTLISLPILLSTGSAATVYVPTNNFYITNLLLNSNATVRVNIRSGVTYLTGNASLGINLNPGSGFVLPGSPDSPWYKSLSTNVPIVIEKADSSGVIAQIGGSVTFFDAL